MITADGLLVRKDHLLIPDLQALPKGLDPWERWIDVSVSQQMLVAYQGTRPVYVTLVSSGRKGTKEDPYETPRGRWRIYSKHVSTTMDGSSATDGNYSIQDVPWTMFFSGSYALHGAFWHRSFGAVRSHGCVNLGPSDARWLFHWSTPLLPEGWHGVNATDESPGSTVVVRD
nr:L,D-transpeptidase [Nannocystis sp. ILAH1]